MASAAAGGAMDEAGRTNTNKKRISDCLVDSDGADEAVDDAVTSPPSPETPRLRIPMFTCARLRFVRLGRKGGGGGGRKEVRKEVAAEKNEAASVDSSGWKAPSSSSGASAEAGMGLSLLFLLAKTCVELNKMAEVRAQMEALLEEMRDQLARTKSNDHAAAPPRTRDLQPSSTASPCRASGSTDTDGRAGAASSSSPKLAGRPHSHQQQEGGKRRDDEFYALTGNPLFDLDRGRAAASSSAMERASGGSETASEVESPAASMDVAGQFQLSRSTQRETSESSDSDGEFIELEGGFAAAGDNNQRRRDSEDGDDEEHGDGVGISALELERGLHELLHRRNRERIEALESSLRRAERKLVEKEMEARLWKDTAKLALQPPQQQGAGHAVIDIDRDRYCLP